MTIRDELNAINVGLAQAFAEQDAELVVSYYTADARMLLHGEDIIRGRTAIEATVREWVKDSPARVRFESDEVIADGSLVVDVGSIHSPSGRSKYVVVYQRQPDGSLQIAVDAPSRDGAAESTG